MSDRCACGNNQFVRRTPDAPYSCTVCGVAEVEETEVRRYEYKVERYFSRAGHSFTEWLNSFGDEGWQLVNSERDEYYTFMRSRGRDEHR